MNNGKLDQTNLPIYLGDLVAEYERYPFKKHVRLGQYVWNTYGKENHTWPELFYADYQHAFDILLESGYFS